MHPPEYFMRRALDLAEQATGSTSPNPMVGAVVVHDDEIVGSGFHIRAGADHAEVAALTEAGDRASGSTLYVTLEPCNHHGRTPPCTEAIIEAGIRRVNFAVHDNNESVDGAGAARLRDNGIEVEQGPLTIESLRMNRAFHRHAVTGKPWVCAKFASSLDGKTATSSKESQWITGTESRIRGHELRAISDAIVVGVGTVIADNPRLTARNENARPLTRIILDSTGRSPENARVFDPDLPGLAMLATTKKCSTRLQRELAARNVDIAVLPADADGRVSLPHLLDELGTRDVLSLIVEGGATVLGAFFAQDLVDELWAFLSLSVIGGTNALGAVGGSGVAHLSDRFWINTPTIERHGSDILVRGLRKDWLERVISNGAGADLRTNE